MSCGKFTDEWTQEQQLFIGIPIYRWYYKPEVLYPLSTVLVLDRTPVFSNAEKP